MTVNATAVWRVRPSGSNTNGGGFDAAITSAGTDYSQQNAAQANGTHGTAAGTSTFTDLTAANFTSAMIGNAMYLTGTGFTTGWYFVTAVSSTTVCTLDRSPGTGTATGTWHLGGGWADFWTNTASSAAVIVPGNTVYILGNGIPNPASYTYDYSAVVFDPVSGNATAGYITFANDPQTPGYKAPPDTTGGMPCIQGWSGGTLLFTMTNPAYLKLAGLWFVSQAAAYEGAYGLINATFWATFGCVLDQYGYDGGLANSGNNFLVQGSEVFSSVVPGGSGTQYVIGGGGAVTGSI